MCVQGGAAQPVVRRAAARRARPLAGHARGRRGRGRPGRGRPGRLQGGGRRGAAAAGDPGLTAGAAPAAAAPLHHGGAARLVPRGAVSCRVELVRCIFALYIPRRRARRPGDRTKIVFLVIESPRTDSVDNILNYIVLMWFDLASSKIMYLIHKTICKSNSFGDSL